jgi:hypothetical protein
MEGPDSQARECQQVNAADPAQPGDRDPFAAKELLLALVQPSDISRKRTFV